MARPLFRTSAPADTPFENRGYVDVQSRILGRVDYDYAIDGQLPVAIMPSQAPGWMQPGTVSYMQIGFPGYWPHVKIRFAMIATPYELHQPGIAAALRLQDGRVLYSTVVTHQRSPGHYFLEGSALLQVNPHFDKVALYLENVRTIVAGSYVEISTV